LLARWSVTGEFQASCLRPFLLNPYKTVRSTDFTSVLEQLHQVAWYIRAAKSMKTEFYIAFGTFSRAA
jgi:hypothetical protein